jgi:hypothetical protein
VTAPAFAPVERATAILLDAGLTEQQAADGFDGLARLLIGHALAEAGRPPGGDVGGGEEEHAQAQATLPAGQFPALARLEQAGVTHDPDRLFDQALDGLILTLQASRPTPPA